MKTLTIIATILIGLGQASAPARAQGYLVNGRDASPAEVQLLVSHGAQPGKWMVSGFGITSTDNEPAKRQPSGGCRYVLDVLLCD